LRHAGNAWPRVAVDISGAIRRIADIGLPGGQFWLVPELTGRIDDQNVT
jgi:hypothetical protein